MEMMLSFACPRCHTPLVHTSGNRLDCPADQLTFRCVEGVWRMLLPERQEVFLQFIQEYETIRKAEGRGSLSAAYYQALPFQDMSGHMVKDWQVRAASFEVFLNRVLKPYERTSGKSLRILDLGAGNGWLSNRLAGRGHAVAAVDLTTNAFDGLGCYRQFETEFTPVQAEFDHLPFVSRSIDLVVFNASLHYATSFETTLRESLRVLEPTGRMVILDTPFYQDKTSGEMMVQERQRQFTEMYGFPSNALASENYLTYPRLEKLTAGLDMACQVLTPFYGMNWALRPLKARLLRRREPAKFHVVVLQKQSWE